MSIIIQKAGYRIFREKDFYNVTNLSKLRRSLDILQQKSARFITGHKKKMVAQASLYGLPKRLEAVDLDQTISIIIPCYNGEKFIDLSIESVYIQDYTPIELIVVDDESTDGSAARIKAWQPHFAEKGNTLKYVYQKNRGLGGAVDTGLKYVTGEYLTLLDADDVYLPGAIRKKVEFLDAHPEYAGVRNNGWRVSGEKRTLFIQNEEEKQITDLFTALSFGETNNWAGTYMVRTSLLFQSYPDRSIDSSRFGQNFQILLPVAYGRKFGYIDEPLMEYRIQAESHSQTVDRDDQYEKECQNSAGWRGIYIDIIEWLIPTEKERQHYLRIYDSTYHRSAMNRAINYQRTEDAAKHYRFLGKTGHMTMEDRIHFASVYHPLWSYLLRVKNKVHRLLSIRNEVKDV